MKRRNIIIAALLAVLLVCSVLFCACNKDKGDEGKDASTTTKAVASEKTPDASKTSEKDTVTKAPTDSAKPTDSVTDEVTPTGTEPSTGSETATETTPVTEGYTGTGLEEVKDDADVTFGTIHIAD